MSFQDMVYTVKVGDMYYDALTGADGATWDEYRNLWHPVDTAPYITPDPRIPHPNLGTNPPIPR